MIYSLQNSFLTFELNTGSARWNISSRQAGGPSLKGVQMGLRFHDRRGRLQSYDDWRLIQIHGPKKIDSIHGPIDQICLETASLTEELHCTLCFALPELHPLFLWNLKIENHGEQPVYLDALEFLDLGKRHHSHGRILIEPGPGTGSLSTLAFFSNGWQSWSYAGAYGAADRFRRTRLGRLRTPTEMSGGAPPPGSRGRFTSEMFGVLGDRLSRRAILAGFLSQRQHFGSLQARIGSDMPSLRMWAHGDGARLDPGQQLTSDWACLHWLDLDDVDPLGPYIEAVAREHGLPPAQDSHSGPVHDLASTTSLAPGPVPGGQLEIPTGWCSWYQYSDSRYVGTITAQDVRKNLGLMAAKRPQLPLQVLQIDDGFEAQIGDWFSFAPSFPDGLSVLAAEIRQAGCVPGLWLAPFIVHPRSRLAAEHPDWLLRDHRNRPANAAYLWNTFTTALDLTHPNALAYAVEVIYTAVHQWGFPYLKLDFLYAAALPGRRKDPTCTRAQALRLGLEALRAAAGNEAFLLGCGCPLGPAIGLVDAMRIGADTSRRWWPSFLGIERFFKAEPNFPSARNAVHNAITRAPLHRRWWINDPDCLLVGSHSELTQAELQSVATTIALTGGSLLLSDDLSQLTPRRQQFAEVLLPLIGQAVVRSANVRILDWFDASTPSRLRLDLESAAGPWHLLALFNWQDRPADLTFRLEDFSLDAGREYLAREFWREESYRLETQAEKEAVAERTLFANPLVFKEVPPHGVILLAVRPFNPGTPQYLGGDLHISQGLELSAWETGPDYLALGLERPGHAIGEIELSLPRPPVKANLDGTPLSWKNTSGNFYLFHLAFDKTARLEVFT